MNIQVVFVESVEMNSYMCSDCGERVDEDVDWATDIWEKCPWCNGTDEKDDGLSHNFVCMCAECLG